MIERKIYTWEEKKKQGDEFELYLLNDIRNKKYPNAIIDNPNKKFDYWDIFINDDIQIECKHDIEAAYTDNICIEICQDGRSSGINATKAKYYAICDGIFDGKTVYIISTAKIRELIENEYENKIRRFVNDENLPGEVLNVNNIRKELKYPVNQGTHIKYMDWYLIPKNIFSKYCLEVNKLNEMTYNDLV